MSLWRLVWRSLLHYWRTNLAVALACAVTAAVLTGGMLVGDSVRYTLGRTARLRLGRTEIALVPQNRFFRAALADDLAEELDANVAPVLTVRGLISNAEGTERVDQVHVLGVDKRFYALGPGGDPLGDGPAERVVLSRALAQRLGVREGAQVLVRIEKPALMPRDVPLVPDADRSVAFRLPVAAVADDTDFGRFALQANQVAAMNAFVPLAWLQDKIGHRGLANMLLLAGDMDTDVTAERADAAVRERWQLQDAGLELRRLAERGVLELRSRRIFIDDVLADAATGADETASPVLTYFVNTLRVGDHNTPYSMVAALGPTNAPQSLIPSDMADDEVVINQWLADDLTAQVGDTVELTYWVLGPMRRLEQTTSTFRLLEIVPMTGAAIDPELMPDFPGLSDVDNCRDWEPGVPVELDRIRPKDEQYWDKYRGTPKAFVTLRAGQRMWRNRYGGVTAVRYAYRDGLDGDVTRAVLGAVDPRSIGLYFQPVRQRGLTAGQQGTDFGQLFLGLSMFLIASAIILTALLFVFGVESRSEQIGLLLALGLRPRSVRRLLLCEGGLVALTGAALGVPGGILYTKTMVYALATMWSDAVTGAEIHFHATSMTLAVGGLGGFVAAMLAIWLASHRRIAKSVRELLSGFSDIHMAARGRSRKYGVGLATGVVSLVGALAIVWIARGRDSQAAAGAFFGAGALMLVCAISLNQVLLRAVSNRWDRPMVSVGGLALRNATRRWGRSLAVIGLLACGVFMVVAVGANRHDPLAGSDRRDSGTGGFALYAKSAIPILRDLNGDDGRKQAGLDGPEHESVSVVHLRLHEGDDASCFNLNRAQRPTLLAVQPSEFARRRAFAFLQTARGEQFNSPWELLEADLGPDVIPAVGDAPTLKYGLHKELGDEIEYTDEKGRTVRLRIVGMIAGSVFQGSLLIAEDRFAELFPSVDGYAVFLVDAPQDSTEAVRRTLSSSLRDYGMTATPTRERLAAFSKVETTYLSIFMMLGGLGLVLGSIGLALVVLRNMLERRGEFAMLRALGFEKRSLRHLVFCEHWGLMASGLVAGVVAAMLAVIPALRSPAAQVPYVSLLITVAVIACSGWLWIWLAASLSLRGSMLEALRNE